ncbi:hypothetical protein D6C90_02798 [Aureobasidium pullulans]|uniref:Zn(2)-C6 fungal-type domain-containing protein n=1 Tax=Aureobasidium pullulans TaxID=5580 RepID=A0A4V4JM95_AURPU|nr:hypothetical protein D6D12_04924 [Aureobasidium pullulans]THX48295.1 hypothetical protein D6D11_06102 [Aureobasidium pullulans]THX93462.1 hypothetical protein D6D08_02063 [Aureobasidium pullulans]THZ50193.1 hypothetical protein D6C90_02798 [Aureobasidium pullulans]
MEEGTGAEWRGSKAYRPYRDVEQHPANLQRHSLTDQQAQSLIESPRTYGNSARSTKERPCDACRRRKTRCVKESGEDKCVLCKFHSQECTYLHEPVARTRKRKAQPIDETNHGNSGDQPPVLRTNVGTGVEEYDELPGESLLKKTLGLQNKHHAHFVGLTEPFSFPRFSLTLGTSQKSTQGGAVIVRKVDDFNAFTIREDQGTIGYDTEQSRVDAIQQLVEPHGKALIDLYFRIVHPSFPILHKGVFLEKYARSYREFSPALLAAVYLLTTNYWRCSPALATKPKPDACLLHKLATESYDLTIYRPKLSSVQAGLLLAQYECFDSDVISCGSRGRLTAQLVSMSHTLGLHMDPSRWDIPEWEISLRCRLAWAIYMQDKWVALIEGRPALLTDRDWIVPAVQHRDFPEHEENNEEGSSEVENGRIIFMQMIELTKILSDILDSIFSLRSHQAIQMSPDPVSALLSRAQPLQQRLSAWSDSAMEVLSLERANSMKLTSIGYLILAHLAVEVSIHRRIICQTMSCASDPNTAAACRIAAKQRWLSALGFVDSLKARHLKSFWYFCSTACLTLLISFGNVLVGSAFDSSEEQFYLEKLKEFRWTLKINGEMGAKFMVTAIRSMILDPREIRKPDPSSTSSVTSPGSKSESSFGISSQNAFGNMSIQPPPGPMAPSGVASGWITPTTFTNPPVFSGFTPGMSMQVPYIPGYTWQPPNFETGPPVNDYLEHMPG